MKLNKYLDFISENSKSGKMMIFYSDEFRELLTHIAKGSGSGVTIARILLQVESNSSAKDTYTLIDKTDKNDMISYVQTNRFYREYPDTDLDIQIGPFIQNSKFWKSGRTPHYSIGRWVRHIFNDVRETPIKDSDLESFVNAYKSTYDRANNVSEKFELVKGEDIRYWYLEDRYEEVRGQLGNSCMRYAKCQKYLDIYVQNPEVCNLLILKGDTPDKIIGRALIWTIDDGSGVAGKKYMDRVYTINDSDRILFNTYAKEHDILTSSSSSYKIKVKEGRYPYYPYMDTFSNYNYETGILSSVAAGDNILELHNTDGTAEDGSGMVWSDYHNEYIDEDDARWCEDVDTYVHYEETVWLEYRDEYVSNDADTVYSEYYDQSYYRKDCVYSDCMNDWLYIGDDDLIEIKIDSSGNIDYCVYEYKKYYIKVDGEYYLRSNYIRDPYTGKFHFINEKIDGENYIKSLEKRLEDDLDVKEKYTLSDGSFDLKKYKSDLEDILIEYVPDESFIKEFTNDYVVKEVDYKYYLPGLYAWILRDQVKLKSIKNYTRDGMEEYKRVLYGILERIPGDDNDKIKRFYDDKFERVWNFRSVLNFFDNFDIYKFNTEIQKRILLMNL